MGVLKAVSVGGQSSISGVLLNVFALFPARVHLGAPWCELSLQASLRMKMKGGSNESHSARVPDPAAISRFRRRESQRRRECREVRRQTWREEETQEKTQGFFSPFFTPPDLF